MNLILPKYMLVTRRFKCGNCGFAFIKDTPSRVEKCPKCILVVFERGYKEGDTLDPYSAAKLRWYSDPSGNRHRDEITHRVNMPGYGQVIVDNRGRIID